MSSMKRLLCACLVMSSIANTAQVFGESTAAPLRVVYIHGTNTRPEDGSDEATFVERAKQLHHYISRHTLLGYRVHTNPVIVTWWDLAQGQDCFYEGGLDRFHKKAGQGSWYTVPRHLAPPMRENAHHVTHDAFWLLSNTNNLQRVLARVHEVLRRDIGPEEPYLIIGHSAGSLVGYKYLQLIHGGGAPTRHGQWKGFVSIGSPVNTFLSSDLQADMDQGFLAVSVDEPNPRPVWLNFNHHNDIIATSLSPLLTSTPDRRVVCRDYVVRRTVWEKLPLIKEFTYNEGHLWAAHGWYFSVPKRFARLLADQLAAMEQDRE